MDRKVNITSLRTKILVNMSALIIGGCGFIIINQLSILYYTSTIVKNMKWTLISPVLALKSTFIIYNNLGDTIGDILLMPAVILGSLLWCISLIIFRKKYYKEMESTRHGTARFAKLKEILSSNKVESMNSDESKKKYGRYGLFMGSVEHNSGIKTYRDGGYKSLRWLSHFGSQHMLIFAPTGSGKGVGIILPVLVTYPDSVFVYDLKRENYDMTSGFRKKAFDNIIIKFEPTNPDGTSAKFNFLDYIRYGTKYEVSDTNQLANMIIDQDGNAMNGSNSHWNISACDLLVGVILHILYTKREKNLRSVALFMDGIDPDTMRTYKNEVEWLTEMGRTRQNIHVKGYAIAKNMNENEAYEYLQIQGLIDNEGVNIAVKSAASKLIDKSGKAEGERSSIISSATAKLVIFKDPIIGENTSFSDFKLEDIQNNKKAVSVYFIVPPNQSDVLTPLVRIFITQLLQCIQSSINNDKREVVFLMDEFPELKKMDKIPSALAKIRGYKARMILIIQDYAQLKSYYGDLASSIFSNCGIRIAYSANEDATAEKLSKMLGYTTVVEKEESYSHPSNIFSVSIGSNVNKTVSKHKSQRLLMDSSEVSKLEDNMIIFEEGTYPILGKKIRWYEDKYLSKRVYNPSEPEVNSEFRAIDKSDITIIR